MNNPQAIHPQFITTEDSTKTSVILPIEELSENPFPTGSNKLIGSEHTFRIRVSNYRVIYSVENDELIVEVIRVGHRKDVYRVKWGSCISIKCSSQNQFHDADLSVDDKEPKYPEPLLKKFWVVNYFSELGGQLTGAVAMFILVTPW